MENRKVFLIKFFIIIVFSQGFFLGVKAQENAAPIPLHLSEAISSTLSNNKTLDLAKLDEKIAESNYKQSLAFYLPQVGFSYTAYSTNNPLNAFGFKLQEKTITAQDFNPTLLNHPGATNDFTTKLDIQQPLLNLDLFLKRKASGKDKEVYHFKTERTKEFLVFEVQKTVIQLEQAYASLEVLQDAILSSKAVFNFTENRFKQGLLQKSDLLNTQVELSSLATLLAKSKSNIQNVSDYLGLLMGKDMGPSYKIVEEITSEPILPDTLSTIASNRSDFLAMEKGIEASDLMIKSTRNSFLPRLNAFGNFQLNDTHSFGFGANAYLFGIQLSWDVFRGNRIKNSISSQVFERDKLREQLGQQKDQSQMELNKAIRNLKDAQFDINQKKLSVEQATESFKITENRFKQGLLGTTDVLRASTQLTQEKFALTESLTNYKMTQAYLQLLTRSTSK